MSHKCSRNSFRSINAYVEAFAGKAHRIRRFHKSKRMAPFLWAASCRRSKEPINVVIANLRSLFSYTNTLDTSAFIIFLNNWYRESQAASPSISYNATKESSIDSRFTLFYIHNRRTVFSKTFQLVAADKVLAVRVCFPDVLFI